MFYIISAAHFSVEIPWRGYLVKKSTWHHSKLRCSISHRQKPQQAITAQRAETDVLAEALASWEVSLKKQTGSLMRNKDGTFHAYAWSKTKARGLFPSPSQQGSFLLTSLDQFR